MRNKEVNNKLQTLAITYLTLNSYDLVIDPPRDKVDFIKMVDNKYYEPYMAVDLARKVSSEKGESFIQVVKEKYSIKNEREEIVVDLPNERKGEIEHLRVPLRNNVRNRYQENRKQATNLNSLRYQSNMYPIINETSAPSAPVPSAPPPLPMPNSPTHIYPMQMEDSNMSHKTLSQSFGNDLNNLETESIISEPPSYNGVITGLSSGAAAKPDRKKKGG